MLGLALMLVLYTATGNFDLVISAVKINLIMGIEPIILFLHVILLT